MLAGVEHAAQPRSTAFSSVLKSLWRSAAHFRHTSRRAAKNDPLSPTRLCTRGLEHAQAHLVAHVGALAARRGLRPEHASTLLTQPTVGSAKFATMVDTPSGASAVADVGEDQDRRPRPPRRPVAGRLPCPRRSAARTRRTRSPVPDRTMSSVASLEQSEATSDFEQRPPDSPEPSVFSIFSRMRRSSLCAVMMNDTRGGDAAPVATTRSSEDGERRQRARIPGVGVDHENHRRTRRRQRESCGCTDRGTIPRSRACPCSDSQ